MNLYQTTEDVLVEYIAATKLDIGHEIVEHLSGMRDEIVDTYTKKFLQGLIDDYANEYKVCKSCFDKLDPIVVDEPHKELDGYWNEKVVVGWECSCGSKYFIKD